jgi:hypothetical protein
LHTSLLFLPWSCFPDYSALHFASIPAIPWSIAIVRMLRPSLLMLPVANHDQ